MAGIRLRAERLAYFGGVIRRDRYRFVVTSWQGDRFVITNLYRRAAELGTRLTEQVNRVLQPVISRRLAAGETVHFSEQVAVNQNGISSGGSVLRWDDFGGYKLSSGRLLLMDKGGNVAIAEQLWDIDNVTLLLEILKARNHKGDAFS